MAAIDDAHEAVLKWLNLPPAEVDLVLGTIIANLFEGDPVNIMVVAGSSTGKSELLRGLFGHKFVHELSSVTPNTFLSGFTNPKNPNAQTSLLPRLEQGTTLVMKEWASILSMHHSKKGEVIGQLREIADGRMVKEFGTGKIARWQGRIGMLGACTPAIESELSLENAMGERFLVIRLPDENRKEMAHRALTNTGKEVAMREEINEAMLAAIDEAISRLDMPVTMDPMTFLFLEKCGDMLSWMRTGVERDREHQVKHLPKLEGPARAVKILTKLARAMCVLRNIDKPDRDVFNPIYHVTFGSIPSIRWELALLIHQLGETTRDVIDRMVKHASYWHLEDMVFLKIVEKSPGQPNGLTKPKDVYRIHDELDETITYCENFVN